MTDHFFFIFQCNRSEKTIYLFIFFLVINRKRVVCVLLHTLNIYHFFENYFKINLR